MFAGLANSTPIIPGALNDLHIHPDVCAQRLPKCIGRRRKRVGVAQVSQEFTSPTALIPDETSDADLMEALAAGNSAAMEVLYDRYSRPVYSFAYRMLADRDHAEDLMQEVFLRAWRRANRYSGTRGSLISWLLSITHNMAIDEIRKLQRRPQKADAHEPDLMMSALRDQDEPVEDQVLASSNGELIRAALTEIPDSQRLVLELGYFHGMTQREISEHLDVPLGTIKTRMRLALKKLQDSGDIQALVQHEKR